MLKIFLSGWMVLLVAIFLNVLVQRFHIMGWYEFLNKLQSIGKVTFSGMTVVDYLWLFLVYPLCLGYAALMGDRLYALIFRL